MADESRLIKERQKSLDHQGQKAFTERWSSYVETYYAVSIDARRVGS